MNSILAIDIGGGTQDILLYQEGQPIENCFKLVLPTPTVLIAKKIREVTEENKGLYLTGHLMGGGACVKAVKEHLAKGLPVSATSSAAKTLSDNLEKVRDMGIEIIEDDELFSQNNSSNFYIEVTMGDLDLATLSRALEPYGIKLPEEVAVAVQDHGESIDTSNRLFRFKLWQEFIYKGGNIQDLLYHEVPSYYTRMKAVQKQAPSAFLMDTGAAAVWGALFDPLVEARVNEGVVIVNVGNNHTLGILLYKERVIGVFEHHTRIITPENIVNYIKKLQDGTITFDEVYNNQGHGAVIHEDFQQIKNSISMETGKEAFSFISVTGPNRYMAKELHGYMAVPGGDMMLAGSFGLVKAVLANKS